MAQRRVILFLWPVRPRRRTRPPMAAGSIALCAARSRPGARESFFKTILDRAPQPARDDGDEPRAYDIPWRLFLKLNVCLATTTRNSSKIHWQRSTIRQRTTPCTAGIGPLSSICGERGAVRAARSDRDGCPGGLQSISPPGPWALTNFITQSRTIWSRHPADLRRPIGPARAVVICRQRQKPPGLREAHPSTTCAAALTIRVSSNQPGSGMGMANASCTRHLESDTRRFGNPPSESRLLSFGIRRHSEAS